MKDLDTSLQVINVIWKEKRLPECCICHKRVSFPLVRWAVWIARRKRFRYTHIDCWNNTPSIARSGIRGLAWSEPKLIVDTSNV